jgi:hypothetical protein
MVPGCQTVPHARYIAPSLTAAAAPAVHVIVALRVQGALVPVPLPAIARSPAPITEARVVAASLPAVTYHRERAKVSQKRTLFHTGRESLSNKEEEAHTIGTTGIGTVPAVALYERLACSGPGGGA